ncbi:MAG: C40 family peptidase [Clostridia bacterium]|nr:C40 family peptidase [Clostridia bacterium]
MKDKKNMAMIIIVGIIILLFLCVNSTAFATTGTVVGDNLRVRKEENVASEVIDLLDENDKVEILGENGDWYKVKVNGKVGYVNKQYIKVQEGNVINNETTNSEENTNTASNENTENNEEAQSKENDETDEKTALEPNEQVKQPKNVKFSTNVELKTMPLISGSAISTTNSNETYEVISIAGLWSYVKSDNKEGWVLTEKSTEVTDSNSKEASQEENNTEETNREEEKTEESSTEKLYSNPKTYYVKGTSVNARSAASKTATVVKVLNTNNEVKVIGEDESWYVAEINGDKAYIAKSLLSSEKIEVTSRSYDSVNDNDDDEDEEDYEEESSSSVPSNPIGEDVVAYALQFEGYSYVYGTNGPNTFDCSGFVQYVYKHFGYSLSRSSSTQANDGVYVSKSDLEPGDVLIFRDTSNSRIGHVGLYIGGGQFIHASNSRTGVIISSLSTSAYQTRYVCARRIL